MKHLSILAAANRLLLTIFFLFSASYVQAATLWEISSRSGDPIANGENILLDESTGTFNVYRVDSEGNYRVEFESPDNWEFYFKPPLGTGLMAGHFPDTGRFATSTNGSQQVVRNHGTCTTEGGWYSVLEVVRDSNRDIVSLAIDYNLECQGTGHSGKIRVNSSVDLGDDNPVASAGKDQVLPEGRAVSLDGSGSWIGDGTSLNYDWRQLSGTPVTIANPNSASISFVAPEVSPGGDLLRFRLDATSSTGKVGSDWVVVRVLDSADELTVVHHQSELGDYLGRGTEEYYEPENPQDVTTVVRSPDGNIEIYYDSPGTGSSSFTFIPHLGQIWATGDYRLHGGERSESNPKLSMSMRGTGCSDHVGRYVIHELEYSTDPINQQLEIDRFAADFDVRCVNDHDGGIRGQVRINSSLPVLTDIPWASAGADVAVLGNESALLNASESTIGYGSIVDYTWTQVSGPTVSLQNANSAEASFIAPEVDIRDPGFVFEVAVSSDAGKTDTAIVHVDVISKSDPQTWFEIDSQAGDTIGNGQHKTIHGHEWNIETGFAYNNDIRVRAYLPGVTSSDWTAVFVDPNAQPVRVGAYENAVDELSSIQGRPRMRIGIENRACSSGVGRFDVLHADFHGSGYNSVAVDFESRCSAGSPALVGKIRVNYVHPSVPVALAGRDIGVGFGEAVTIDGTASNDSTGSIQEFKWQQVAGHTVNMTDPNAAILEFTAPTSLETNSVPQHLVFELIVTDDEGFQSWDAVNVTVGTNASPITADDNFVVAMDIESNLQVLLNDYDPNGDEIDTTQVTVLSNPSNGFYGVKRNDGSINYKPTSGFSGTDKLRYEIYDLGGLRSDDAWVYIKVNAPPTANDDTALATSAVATSIALTGNDVDADGVVDGDSIIVTTPPGNGTTNPSTYGTISYRSNAGFTGTDSFQYEVKDSDGFVSNVATVTITVSEPVVPPPTNNRGGGSGGGGAVGTLVLMVLMALTWSRRRRLVLV